MKYLISILMLVSFTFAVQAEVMFLGSRAHVLNLEPVLSVTASGDSSAIDLKGYSGNCAALVDVSAPVSGTNPALALKLTESDTSGGSYSDVSGGAFASVSSTASVQKVVFNSDKQKRYVKLNRVLSGTASPQYLMSAKILCDKKYR